MSKRHAGRRVHGPELRRGNEELRRDGTRALAGEGAITWFGGHRLLTRAGRIGGVVFNGESTQGNEDLGASERAAPWVRCHRLLTRAARINDEHTKGDDELGPGERAVAGSGGHRLLTRAARMGGVFVNGESARGDDELGSSEGAAPWVRCHRLLRAGRIGGVFFNGEPSQGDEKLGPCECAVAGSGGHRLLTRAGRINGDPTRGDEELGACAGRSGSALSSARGRPTRFAVGTLLALIASVAFGATRPQYGGTLRVEVRQNAETADPPPLLANGFTISRWEAGRRAVYEADDNAAGGRPFLDAVEIVMGRSLREQLNDLELGRADVVELGPAELRRLPAGRRVWSSSPVRVLALVFAPRFDDARVREALALAVDRSAIHGVLLQRQGEISGALLPQWLSGYAFLFPTAADLGRARQLAAGARPLSLGVSDPAMRPIAERIALNARDAMLRVTVTAQPENADVRLVELRITSSDPAKALAALASSLGLPEPNHVDTPEQTYAAERALLEGYRVIPLIHLPDVYGVAPHVKGGPGVTPLGEWRFENLWLEGARP
ncbi:MAG: extracellular solute-binding protein family 5 [Candidatus Solibacter sp.]|nr:extracellular solute-binding protein family 5 [Candidatus Solibacter sp.]